MSRSRHRRRDATTTRARRSLPVTTSEVASCLSRKRKKMSAKDEDEEDPSSSPHQNNKKEDAIVELGDRTAAEGTTMKVAGPVAATGRPHTAPAGCPTESPAKMEEPEMDARQNQVVSCEKTTKKTTKRSRILTSTDGIVVGGAGRGGQSARNSGGHSSSSNVLASSYYLYHGHRHTNDGRTCSSSSNPLQDCWSMNHEEEKKYGSRCVNKVSRRDVWRRMRLFTSRTVLFYFALRLISTHRNANDCYSSPIFALLDPESNYYT